MGNENLIADPVELDVDFSITNLPKFIKRTNDGEGSKEKFQFFIYYKNSNGVRSKKTRVNTGSYDEETAKAKAYELLCMFKEDPSTILTYKTKQSADPTNQSWINWLNQPFYLTLLQVFEHNIKVRNLRSTNDYYSAFSTIMIPYFKHQHPTLLTKNVDIGVIQQMFDIISGKMCPNIEVCHGCSYRRGENELPCDNAEHICMKRIMFDKERELNKSGKPCTSKYNAIRGDSIKHLKTYLNMTFKYVSDRVLGKDSDMKLFKNHVSDIKEHLRIEAVSKARACLEPFDVEKLRGLLLSDIMTVNVEDSKFELVALYLCLAFGLRIGEAASVKLSKIHLTESYVRLENYISIEGNRKDTKRKGPNTRPHLKGISSNHVVIDIKDETQSGVKKLHKRMAYVVDANIYRELKQLIAYRERIEREMYVEVEAINPEGYFCIYNDGSVLSRVDRQRNLFKGFLKAHGIHVFDKETGECQDDQFVPHSLRHSFITGLEIFDNHGFTAAAIRWMTAHSATSDAHEVYIHQLTVRVEYGAEYDQPLIQRIEKEFGRSGEVRREDLQEAKVESVESEDDINGMLVRELLSRCSGKELLQMLLEKRI